MPINTIRLNHQKSSHPNDRIIFIKPLPRPSTQQSDHDIADTFLRAIAAQCLPIMKKHWLSVTTLEEYEPNREFMGRNFNHGECIQLVLRAKSGGWLPFNMVQMVMMHELAHNVEMNHSKRFWAKRNEYAGEMRELWGRGYTGEGFWGSGRVVGDMSSVMGDNVVASEELGDLPLCGGTYRSRRRKRRANGAGGEELTWREKKERRIEKKFGKNGVSLGSDEDTRLRYEIGKKGPIGGTPRVAQSKRGRELRAAAALARFEQSKVEVKKDEDIKEEDGDDYEDADVGVEDATDLDGQRLLDKDGRSMVRICEEEDVDDVHVKQEMEELEGLERYFPYLSGPVDADHKGIDRSDDATKTSPPQNNPEKDDRRSDATTVTPSPSPEPSTRRPPPPTATNGLSDNRSPRDKTSPQTDRQDPPRPPPATATAQSTTQPSAQDPASSSAEISCQICSLLNPSLSATCSACGHVLDKKKDPKHWNCGSDACRSSGYINAGDAGVCGLCGARRIA